MEVIPSRSGGSGSIPFQRHNVEEWSRLDRLTGMLEHARVETDHWAANTSNSSHKYGKVVDSRARNLADGSVQQRQRKQLEVFQSQVPGGSFQVIRTQSVTSTSSSWRSDSSPNKNALTDFENLQLTLNPLDLSSQKTKASVGRSGSIGSRRPPSRPRSSISKVGSAISEEHTSLNTGKQNAEGRLSDVSRICQQIHEEVKKNVLPSNATSFKNFSNFDSDAVVKVDDLSGKHSSNSNDENSSRNEQVSSARSSKRTSVDSFEASSIGNSNIMEGIVSNGLFHAAVTRKKSCSTEDLQNSDNQEKNISEENRILSDWKRDSKVRRSLQFPTKANHLDFIPNGNVSKLRKELEEGKKLGSMRSINSSLETFGNILKHNTDSEHNVSLKEDDEDICRNYLLQNKSENGYQPEGFSRRHNSSKSSPQKRHSFVTVESLKEVRGRLKHLSSPLMDGLQHPYYLSSKTQNEEDSDDGIIVTEDHKKVLPERTPSLTEEIPTSRVKSYIYGMEAIATNHSSVRKPTIGGTGSLESRMSNKSSSSSGSRSEEWYNRRKSYGFEQVHNDQNDNQSQSVIFQDKNRVESSTDSGICRSSETVTSSSWSKLNSISNNIKDDGGNIMINHSIEIKKPGNMKEGNPYEGRDPENSTQKGRRTVVTLGRDSESKELHINNRKNWTASQTNTMTNASSKSVRRLSEPVTVTIPIVSDDFNGNKSNTIENKGHYLKQVSDGTNLRAESDWSKPGTLLQNGNAHVQKNLSDESKSLAARRERLLKHTALQETASQLGIWSGRDGYTHPSKKIDREVKRHSIAVDECKYVRRDLNSYNFTDRAMKNMGFQNELNLNSTRISDFETSNCYSSSTKKEAVPHQSEQECRMLPSIGISQNGTDIRPISSNFDDEDCDEFSMQNHLTNKKQKKVEFCKTEVHFAAEPGRFNIVETDEKPPPTNMFRRRRRSNTALTTNQNVDASKANLPEIRFGDSVYEKKLLGVSEASSTTTHQIAVSFENNNTSDLSLELDNTEPVRSLHNFQDDADKEDNIYTQANATIFTSSRQEMGNLTVHNDAENVYNDSTITQPFSPSPGSPNGARPRSILKNYRKPRPFHLGEMEEDHLVNEKLEGSNEDPEARWGVRLRPVQNKDSLPSSPSMWRSTVTLQNTSFEEQQQQSYSPSLTMLGEETELQKLLKSLRPASKKKSSNDCTALYQSQSQSAEPITSNSVEVKISSVSPVPKPAWSVAERIRQVEDMKNASVETRGYSTRVNFGAGEATVIESGSSDDQQGHIQQQSTPLSSLYQQNSRPKPIWLRREERRQDGMQQTDIKGHTTSDKGLTVHISRNGANVKDGESDSQDSKLENNLRTEDSSMKKTTTITIDLSPSSEDCNNKMGAIRREMKKKGAHERTGKGTGTLRSPSLIMKTISKGSQDASRGECKSSTQQMQGVGHRRLEVKNNATMTVTKHKKIVIQPNKYEKSLCDKSIEKRKTEPCPQESEEDAVMVVPNQLAALKELYYSAELSDDSERADEEVRSYMSGGGDDDDEDASSVVSGSWSRMRAYRNLHKFSTSQQAQQSKGEVDGSSTMKIEDSKHIAQQQSIATANLQSYNDSSRLRSVETLVSTRSGHPKITSISLRYEGDQGPELGSHNYNRNSEYFRKGVQSPVKYDPNFRTLQPSKKNSLHITEPIISPSSLGVINSTTDAGIKSYNEKKPLLTQQIGIPTSSFKTSDSLFIQTSKQMSQTYNNLTHQKQFTSEERQYENLNTRSTKRSNSDHIGADKLSSSTSRRKDLHAGHETNIPHHSSINLELSSKSNTKQETGSTFSSEKNNRRSQSPIERKTLYKDQHRKQFPSPVLSRPQNTSTFFGVSSLDSETNSSDFVSSNKNSTLESKKRRPKIKDEDMKKESNMQARVQSRRNQRHKDENIRHEMQAEDAHIISTIDTHTFSVKRDRSLSPSKGEPRQNSTVQNTLTDNKLEKKVAKSPVYENVKTLSKEFTKKADDQSIRVDFVETESSILEELTRAADQILQAVNGYTDEDSYKASSDDDFSKDVTGDKRRRGKRSGQMRRPSANLGTISETPSSKKQQETGNSSLEISHKNSSNSKKSQRLAKARLGPTSSTSSVESFTKEISRTSSGQNRTLSRQEHSGNTEERKRKVTSSSASSAVTKSGSRTARLLQRASSRELLLQTYASSSEDVGSGVEGGSNRKPTAPRRTRVHKTDSATVNIKKTSVSSNSQQSAAGKAKLGKRDVDAVKPKERFPGSTSKMVPMARKNGGGESCDQVQGSRLHTSRTREEEGHQKSSSRSARKDNRHKAQGVNTQAVVSSSRDRGERSAVSSRHAVSRSSTSCVVTKKKPTLASSHNGLVQEKAAQ